MLVFTHQSIRRHIAEHGDLLQQLIFHLIRSSLLQCSQPLSILPTKHSPVPDQSSPPTHNHSNVLALYQINILNSTVLDKSTVKNTN